MTGAMPANYIVVTRPAPAGELLCQTIEQKGGKALHFPSIAFKDAPDVDAFNKAVQQMGEQDWLIFNSPQSVKSCVPTMRRVWPNFPESVKIAAVGAGTATALKQAGYLVSVYPENEWSSEGLLDLPEMKSMSGRKVMLIRGVGGREILQKKLNERGGLVTNCIAYERIVPNIDPKPCQDLIKNNQVHTVIAGSFESVNNLKLLLGEEFWPLLCQVPFIVMSERIKALATELGCKDVHVVNVASEQAVLNYLSQP